MAVKYSVGKCPLRRKHIPNTWKGSGRIRKLLTRTFALSSPLDQIPVAEEPTRIEFVLVVHCTEEKNDHLLLIINKYNQRMDEQNTLNFSTLPPTPLLSNNITLLGS